MKIFITGASGWIGSAVVQELLEAGHSVAGLARSNKSAETLRTAGVEVVGGNLDDLEILKQAAASSDGVIHLAFKHDIAFSGDFQGAADADRKAVEAFAEVLKGTDKPFVIASGLLGLSPGKIVTENDGHGNEGLGVAAQGPAARLATAEFVLSLASQGVRSSIVRLAPTNHGDGDNGFMATIVQTARDKGVAGYVGDGSNRWPAVHRLDSAHLFRLAIEKAPAGSTLHAAADEGVPMREIAEVIGKHLDIPVSSIASEDVAKHFSWMASFIGLDSPASSQLTRELLGWNPKQVGLIEDLEQEHYYQ